VINVTQNALDHHPNILIIFSSYFLDSNQDQEGMQILLLEQITRTYDKTHDVAMEITTTQEGTVIIVKQTER